MGISSFPLYNITQKSPDFGHKNKKSFMQFFNQLGFHNRGVAKVLKITEANAIKLDQRAKARLRELCQEEEIL